VSKENVNGGGNDVIAVLVEYLQTGAGKIGQTEQKILLIETIVNRHSKLLTDGNGSPPFIVQVSDLQTRLRSVEESLKRLDDSRIQLRNAVFVLIGTIITAIAAIIAAYAKSA